MLLAKTSKLEELQQYMKYALNGFDMALQLPTSKPFWKTTRYLFISRSLFERILKSITMKWKWMENKQVIVGFGNWKNPRDSIIRGHCRGPVKEIMDELQKWCEVVDVD